MCAHASALEQDIDWLGHAGFRMKIGRQIVYIDPYRAPRGPARPT